MSDKTFIRAALEVVGFDVHQAVSPSKGVFLQFTLRSPTGRQTKTDGMYLDLFEAEGLHLALQKELENLGVLPTASLGRPQ